MTKGAAAAALDAKATREAAAGVAAGWASVTEAQQSACGCNGRVRDENVDASGECWFM
jgi:hypothetical protein